MSIDKSKQPLEYILQNNLDDFSTITPAPDKFRLQILYTQIDRDENNNPLFKQYKYNVQNTNYFYPASTVKLPAALLALEKLNNLSIANVNRDTWLRIDSAAAGQSVVWEDLSAPDEKPSIGHYINKIFLVSDNDAYNRLFEFLGQQYLNETLWAKGYKDARILRRLESGVDADGNRKTNPFLFYGGENLFYDQPAVVNELIWTIDMPEVRQGRGYISGGKLVEEPIDFSNSNYLSLEEMQQMLIAVFFPQSLPENKRFNLTPDDYQFLYSAMSTVPRNSSLPQYSAGDEYHDSYVKFFLFGDSKKPIPANLRIYNKAGQAYGYLIDNAYVVDFDAGVEFLLSAVIQVNKNQIYNDDKYEYDTVGIPFLANLGRAVYQLEKERQREYRPDFSSLQRSDK